MSGTDTIKKFVFRQATLEQLDLEQLDSAGSTLDLQGNSSVSPTKILIY